MPLIRVGAIRVFSARWLRHDPQNALSDSDESHCSRSRWQVGSGHADRGFDEARRMMREEGDFSVLLNHLDENLARELDLFV